ncbi:hypothetical protein [Brevundimonas sp. LjRoot202]|uniref:hypothetical protein n=1 Tax=Brevundimonas sp. LjRoot202 TaxID=3342281 RepID=UPI003ECD5A6B
MSDFPISSTRPRRAVRPTWAGLTVAVIAVVIWAAVATIQRMMKPPEREVENLSFLIGQDIGGAIGVGLMIGGVVSLVLYFTYVQHRAPERGAKHFLILWGTASAIGLLPILLGLAAQAANPSRGQDAAIMAEHEARSAAIPDRLDLYRRVAEAQAKLTPEAVAAPGGVEGARRAVAELKTLENTAQEELKVVMDDTEAKLLALRLTDRQRDTMQRELADEQARAGRTRILSRRAVELQGLQIEVLARQPRAWQPQGDSIAFARQQDLEDFNVLAEELTAIGTEMESLRTRSEPTETKRP